MRIFIIPMSSPWRTKSIARWFAFANISGRGVCGRREKQESAGRAESVGEGEKAHSRDDTVVLPRQTRDERGRSVRGVQSAHSICALPPRKMPLQGQQKILFLL